MSDLPVFIPHLAYDDAPSALDFLSRAFGFEEAYRLDMPDGSIGHAEMHCGAGRLFLATTWKAGGMASAKDLPAVASQLQVEVGDVDAHYERACAEGAIIAEPPTDQFHGSRSYRAIDPEGHRWIFSQTLRHVSASELQTMLENGEAD